MAAPLCPSQRLRAHSVAPVSTRRVSFRFLSSRSFVSCFKFSLMTWDAPTSLASLVLFRAVLSQKQCIEADEMSKSTKNSPSAAGNVHVGASKLCGCGLCGYVLFCFVSRPLCSVRQPKNRYLKGLKHILPAWHPMSTSRPLLRQNSSNDKL